MLEDQDSEFILSIFLMEAWDTVASVEDGMRRLEAGEPPSSGMIDPLVVVAHRLKGAAGLHGYPVVSAVSLVLERMLEELPAVPPEDRARELEILGEVIAGIKRMLETIGDDGREDVLAVARLRERYPERFAPPPPPDPVADLWSSEPLPGVAREPALAIPVEHAVPAAVTEPAVAAATQPEPEPEAPGAVAEPEV